MQLEYIPVAIHGKVENIYLVLHDLSPSGIIIPIHNKIKKIFCLSEWHVDYFLKIFPQFTNITTHFYYGSTLSSTFRKSGAKIETTTNINSGAKIETIPDINNGENLEPVKIPYKFIYSSFPNRGLLQLLQLWSQIIKKYPEASLHI